MVTQESVLKHLKTSYFKNVIIKDTIDSTNSYALQHAKEYLAPSIIIATTQSAGKGQNNKVFYSPTGGLYMTLLFSPKHLDYRQAQFLTIGGVMAVVTAIESLYGITTEIKWLNDIYIQQKKICGILLESVYKRNEMEYAAIGIGINTHQFAIPKELEAKVSTIAAFTEKQVDKTELITAIVDNFVAYLTRIEQHEFQFVDAYRDKNFLIGKQIMLAGSEKEYLVTDINELGHLVVTNTEETKTLNAGSVSIRAW